MKEKCLKDPILLTPGPLTTSAQTKSAMLSDFGSWDGAFNAVTASVCRDLLAIVEGHADKYSGRFRDGEEVRLAWKKDVATLISH